MQITKITLTRVFTTDKDKEGNPLVAKTSGRPYSKTSVKCVEHGDKWLSGFKGKENEFWKEGDVVEVIVKQNGDYLNFEVPKSEDKLEMRVSAMEVEMHNMRNSLAKLAIPTAGVLSVTSTPSMLQGFNTQSAPSNIDEPPF